METIKNMKITKRYLLLYPDGTTIPAEPIIIQSDESLTKLLSIILDGHVNYAFANHMEIMQKLELVSYGNGSDKGHYNYLYKGALIFELLRTWLKQEIAEQFNAFEIRTPFIFDWNRKDIQGQAGLFSESIYRVLGPNSKKEFVLRYGGDAGVFSIMRDAQLTYRHLPFRLFEDCQGFRVTQTGAISGIRRGVRFLFPMYIASAQIFKVGLKNMNLFINSTLSWLMILSLTWQ
jgi:threonyl-tRNA synthetase